MQAVIVKMLDLMMMMMLMLNVTDDCDNGDCGDDDRGDDDCEDDDCGGGDCGGDGGLVRAAAAVVQAKREKPRCNSTSPKFNFIITTIIISFCCTTTLMNLDFSSPCSWHKIVCNCTRFQNQVQQITIKWHPCSSGSYTGIKVLAQI